MSRITLLNDGDFGSMRNVKFPAEVEGTIDDLGRALVSESEIRRVGGDEEIYSNSENTLMFVPWWGECEAQL